MVSVEQQSLNDSETHGAQTRPIFLLHGSVPPATQLATYLGRIPVLTLPGTPDYDILLFNNIKRHHNSSLDTQFYGHSNVPYGISQSVHEERSITHPDITEDVAIQFLLDAPETMSP